MCDVKIARYDQHSALYLRNYVRWWRRITAARAYIYRHFNAETFATVDSRLSLICVAAGNPPPTITWTLDDEPLPTADDDDDQQPHHVIVSSVTPDGDVVSYVNVSGVRVTDGGTYRCTATNRVGVESFSGRLFVYGMYAISTVITCWPPAKRRMVYNFGRVSVCLSGFPKLCWRRKFISVHQLYLQGIRIKFVYKGHQVKVKVTGAKIGRKSLFLQCQISIGNNSGSIKHRVMTFTCSMGFWAMADPMVWSLSLSHDRKWPRITKCMHSRVVAP